MEIQWNDVRNLMYRRRLKKKKLQFAFCFLVSSNSEYRIISSKRYGVLTLAIILVKSTQL